MTWAGMAPPRLKSLMRNFNLASVNMRRRNATMHALLNTNSTDDILFIQEPWFNRIGVARSDAHREGVDVLGGAANPSWNISYPYFNLGTTR
jgi:hypothetical protein